MLLFIFDIILVVIQIVVCQASGEYYESNITSEWTDAVDRCNLTTPNINLTKEGFTVDIKYTLNQNEAWLGFFTVRTVFEYIGCVKIDVHKHITKAKINSQYNSPGLCYTVCKGKEIIGVSIDKCICLDNVENYLELQHYLEPHCNTPCSLRGQGATCGGPGFMSVYRVNLDESVGDSHRRCLSFERLNGKIWLLWEHCSSHLPVECDNGTGTEDVSNTYQDWTDSVNTCIQKGLRPASYQALRRLQQDAHLHSWSGVISSDVIHNFTAWRKNYTGIQFAYMTANTSVHFADEGYKKYTLCNRTATEKYTTSTTRPTAEINNSSTICIIDTTDINKKTQGEDVIVAVSASVSIILIAAAVVTAYVFLRRRGKIPDECPRMAKTTNEDADHSNSPYVTVHQPSYENVEYVSDAVLSEQGDYCTLNVTRDSNYDHTYSMIRPYNSGNSAKNEK